MNRVRCSRSTISKQWARRSRASNSLKESWSPPQLFALGSSDRSRGAVEEGRGIALEDDPASSGRIQAGLDRPAGTADDHNRIPRRAGTDSPHWRYARRRRIAAWVLVARGQLLWKGSDPALTLGPPDVREPAGDLAPERTRRPPGLDPPGFLEIVYALQLDGDDVFLYPEHHGCSFSFV